MKKKENKKEADVCWKNAFCWNVAKWKKTTHHQNIARDKSFNIVLKTKERIGLIKI
jgi:hypothetical protein